VSKAHEHLDQVTDVDDTDLAEIRFLETALAQAVEHRREALG
jgi:hypothetical protein